MVPAQCLAYLESGYFLQPQETLCDMRNVHAWLGIHPLRKYREIMKVSGEISRR